MAEIQDVAAYILQCRGPMTAMKLQKLCYYSHAWHLVWEEQPLFQSQIQAWANGPVIVDLYRMHRGQFQLADGDISGSPEQLATNERDSIDEVLKVYGDKPAYWLSELTHREDPWKDARERAGLAFGERGEAVIADAAMHEYYLNLLSTVAPDSE